MENLLDALDAHLNSEAIGLLVINWSSRILAALLDAGPLKYLLVFLFVRQQARRWTRLFRVFFQI